MSFKFNNYARLVEKQGENDYYEWLVFMDEPPETLNRVTFVVYRLHESFPDPLRRVWDRERHFALQDAGRGDFDIFIRVHLHDDSEERTEYHLDLSKPWPTGAPVGAP